MKTKGIYFLYRALQGFGLPALLFYFFLRGLRDRGYWRSLRERLGFLPDSYRQTGPGAIWLHAVSVGEVLSCLEFLKRLRGEFPRTALFVSTSTLAGQATAREKLGGIASAVFYAPVDYVFAVRRVLRTLQPSVVIVAETEIWPNLFREVKRTGAALALVNGRVSDRAWPRYVPLLFFFRRVLPALDMVLAQSEEMRTRFLALGAAEERVRAGGNFKYDFTPKAAAPGSPVAAFLDALRPARVWVAASTMPPAEARDPDEDDVVLAAFAQLAARYPDLALVLVPRKPERFDTAARKLDALGIPYARRSALSGAKALSAAAGESREARYGARVLLLDTIGELSGVFALADVVFMGGTLAQRGGHNILEPAFFGKPVIVGPHMENFRAIADEFHAAGAVAGIAGPQDLAAAVERLLDDPATAREIGRRAGECARARGGATARAVDVVGELYAESIARYRPAQPWFTIRWLLARLWEWGARRRQARGRKRQRALPVPVVSVGNLTMGGTGKTPCVLRLAEIWKERGRQPAILTRGHGRLSSEKYLALAPGAAMRAEHSGDEPQIFLRSRLAPVGIGADRFQAGTLLLRQFAVDVVLLDDGFQHLRLARDVDVVLVDALNPFPGGDVSPLGRLREPPEGLARADIVVITRSDLADTAPAVERAVRGWNPHAPVFRARVEPRHWVEHPTGRRQPAAQPPFHRVGAFCGVGNPEAFRRVLERLGLKLADWVVFDDHHRYRPHELRRLAQRAAADGAEALVTTEKDTVNLCEGWEGLVAPLPLYWLEVTMAIEGEAGFVAEIERRIARGR